MTREAALEVLELMERMLAGAALEEQTPSDIARRAWCRLVGLLEYSADTDTGDRLLPGPAFTRLANNGARSARGGTQ